MNLKILILPGDGIGTEVTGAAVDVLKTVAKKFGHTLELSEGLLGGIAIHKTGTPFPKETEMLAVQADATLMGAVGLPEFDAAPPSQRPEAGLLGLRKVLDVFANLRPVRTWPALVDSSPLKNHVVEGTDMIIVVASSAPVLTRAPAQNADDNAAPYLRDLANGIARVRQTGGQVAGTLLLVNTLPK